MKWETHTAESALTVAWANKGICLSFSTIDHRCFYKVTTELFIGKSRINKIVGVLYTTIRHFINNELILVSWFNDGTNLNRILFSSLSVQHDETL